MEEFIIDSQKVKYGMDPRVILPILLIAIFCFSFIIINSSSNLDKSKIADKSIAKKTGPSLSSIKALRSSSLNSTVVPDDSQSVANSINTSNVQPTNDTSSASGQDSSKNQAQPVNLQASTTSGDPNSLNITVPKTKNGVIEQTIKNTLSLIP